MLATIPVASRRATLPIATREKRGTTTARAATRFPGSDAAARTRRPTRPPTQIDAAAMCAQSSASIAPTGLVVEGWPPRPGRASAAAAHPAAPSAASSASPDRRLRPGLSSASAAPEATASSPSTTQRSLKARPKAESRTSGTISPKSLHGLSETPRSRAGARRVRHQRHAQRHRGGRDDGPQGALVSARHLQRPGDHAPEREQADRAHHRQQQHPTGADQARCRRALAE